MPGEHGVQPKWETNGAREILDDLRVRPLSVPAQVLERWADRNGGEHLAALGKLAEQARDRRLEALEARIATSGLAGLSAEERMEFQSLIVKRGARKAGP
jgi:hypothetical protein